MAVAVEIDKDLIPAIGALFEDLVRTPSQKAKLFSSEKG